MASTRAECGVFEEPTTPLCVLEMKERDRGERGGSRAIIASDANDLLCGQHPRLVSPGPSDTEDQAH